MKNLRPKWDGDLAPISRVRAKDIGVVKDTVGLAVEFYVYDIDGAFIARRPGVATLPRSSGDIDIYLRGRETDWDGLGKRLLIIPKIYMPVSAGAPATNLLTNASFDTDTTPANGIADGWSLSAASTATYSVSDVDPAPSVIYGKYQSIARASVLGTEAFEQALAALTINPGDRWSAGVWMRCDRVNSVGQPIDDTALAVELHDGAPDVDYTNFIQSGSKDWAFYTASVIATGAHAAARLRLLVKGPTGTWRFDDAFLFAGEWRVLTGDPYRLEVTPKPRVPKIGGNQLAGVGSFESDSNSDGFPDGIHNASSGNTFSLDATPANVAHEFKSLKVVLANQTGKFLKVVKHGRYEAGQVWRASIKHKTSGALAGAPGIGNNAYGILLSTSTFEESVDYHEGSLGSFGLNDPAFVTYQSDLTLLGDVNELVVSVWLNQVTGTAWFDELILTRVS